MNIARSFSYTRLLERELIRERRRHDRERAADRAAWEAERIRHEQERQRLENVVFLAHGANAPHRDQHLRMSRERPRTIPPAIGPIGRFGLAARNAAVEDELAQQVDEETRRVPETELSIEARERLRKAAEERGLPLNAEEVA